MWCRTIPNAFGTAGSDIIPVKELYAYLSENRERIESELFHGKYLPQPIRGRAERKENVQRTFLAKNRFAPEILRAMVTLDNGIGLGEVGFWWASCVSKTNLA